MLRGYSFRPRLWALALAGAACAAFIALGNWQSRRAEEKRALGATQKRVVVRGEFVPGRTVYLDNRLRGGRPGYEVVTPLTVAPSRYVLVNRGWVERARLADVRTPAGEVSIEGIALARLAHALEAGKAQQGAVRQNLDIAAYAAETGLALEPMIIEQHSDDGDGLLRDWPRPDLGVEQHEAYALQWYSFAAVAVALFLVLSFKRVAKS